MCFDRVDESRNLNRFPIVVNLTIRGRLPRVKASRKRVSDELLNEKVKEGHLRFVEWLMETQFLRSKPVQCCDADATLEVDEGSIDGVAWGCGACGRRQTVRTGSIFAKSCDESLCWIMRLILCWSDNVRLVKFQPLSLFLVLPSL